MQQNNEIFTIVNDMGCFSPFQIGKQFTIMRLYIILEKKSSWMTTQKLFL